MKRALLTAGTVAALGCLLSACGEGRSHLTPRIAIAPAASVTDPSRPYEVLSLSGLGRFEGRCPRGAHSWRLRFVDDEMASDAVSYRVGDGQRHTVNVNPGHAITIHLVPNATRTREPAIRFVPPGQGRGRTKAESVPSTEPLGALIYQATEPQTLRATVHLAFTTMGGESGRCALVGSSVHAHTNPNQH
jgi:hypothetical protein